MSSTRLGAALRRSALLPPVLLAVAASCGGATPSADTAASSPTPASEGAVAAPAASVASTAPSTSSTSSASSASTAAVASSSALPALAAPSNVARCVDASLDAATRLAACEAACRKHEGASLRWVTESAEACVAAGELATTAATGARATLRAAHDFDDACRAPDAKGAATVTGCAKRDALLQQLRTACSAKELASCVAHGRGVATMLAPTAAARAQAIASLTLACDAKSAEACEVRGDLQGDHDAKAALASYQQGCELDRGHACCQVAQLLRTGAVGPADDAGSLAARNRARRSGDASCLEEWSAGGFGADKPQPVRISSPIRTVDAYSYLPPPAPTLTLRLAGGGEELEADFRSRLPRATRCLEREVVVNGEFDATIWIGGSIDATGKYTAPSAPSGGAASDALRRCVVLELTGRPFPAARPVANFNVELRARGGR